MVAIRRGHRHSAKCKTRFSRAKSQSAMEYLMTYGWAILVIAVVLGVLFQLGVFSAGNFAPKAKPGQCQVQVVGSAHQLEGLCSPELPQYVAQLTSGYVKTSTAPADFLPSYTINFWMYPTSSNEDIIEDYTSLSGAAPACPFYYIFTNPYVVLGSWNLNYAGYWITTTSTIKPALNTWSMVTITLSGGGVGTGSMVVYLNGGSADPLSAQEVYSTALASDGGAVIGISGTGCPGAYGGGGFSGSMANFQIYNATLSSTEVAALYQEGIGGAPVKPQNITAWWPMNSNFNDYSGNSNNAQGFSAGFSSTWASTYTGPQ